ncbi:MAG: class I SAM-dependent methyltransferase [Myxococcota bacterium]|jgi:2-polyprenyl-3-methyl-5-hydroxy-6-metoxy-1,4-benzoquinol methylase
MAATDPLVCPMCGGREAVPQFKSANGYDVVRCAACRLVFVDARAAPPPSELYPPFEQTDTAAQRSARTALSLFTLQRARFVESVKPGGRLLDYGAGSGAFARFMAGRGFDAVGLEPYSLGTTTEEPNLRLVRAPLAQVKGELGKFDVITMWHVLEHLEHPVEILTELRGLLASGGVLVVSVPNFASWQSGVFTGGWFHLDPPRHLLQFEPDTLADCLKRAGFRVTDEAPFLPEYGTSGWIQSALNRVLPHKNFLYEWVKDRGALASMSTLSKAAHFVASVAGSVPLFVASIPVEYMAAKKNQAAALTVAAQVSE